MYSSSKLQSDLVIKMKEKVAQQNPVAQHHSENIRFFYVLDFIKILNVKA